VLEVASLIRDSPQYLSRESFPNLLLIKSELKWKLIQCNGFIKSPKMIVFLH